MDEAVTLVTSIASGAKCISSGFLTVFDSLIENPSVLALIGLAIGYGIVKFVIHFLPMIKSH